MRLSVIILTCNQREYTRRCLASLGTLLERDDTEVIVIDNASNDGTATMIGSEFPHVEVIINSGNRGVAPARNQGLQRATGKYVMLLDNDTIASAEAIDCLAAYLDNHSDVGLVASRLVDGDGVTQDSAKSYPGLLVKARNVLGLKSSKSTFPQDEDGAIEPEYVIGACQMMRREVIEQIGLLDEAIFYGPEDADWCLRVKQAGWKIHCLYNYTIMHDYRRSTKTRPLSPLGRKHIKALLYFYWKTKRLF